MTRFVKKYFSILIIIIIFEGCGIYTFSGASIDPRDKTVSVKKFPNRAPIVNPTLSRNFTQKLEDRLTSQTSLSLTRSDGDLQFEGEIIDYSTTPIAITQGQKSATTRLTVIIKVKFISINKPELNFEESFSKFADFSANENLSSVEATLTEDIIEQLTDEIFKKALSNW